MRYDGGEAEHLPTCPYYPESLTKVNDDKIKALEAKNGELLGKLKQCGCGDYIGNCSCWTREIEGMTFRIRELEKKA